MTFKKVNFSVVENGDGHQTHPAGTLIVNSDNQLVMHDGITYGGNVVGGNQPMPRAASPINVQNPDVSLGAIRVMMNNGVINILSSQGANLALLYTGRVISTSGNTEAIVSSGATSLSPGEQSTLATLVNRGDTLIIDSLYDANSNTIYRITVMVTWSSLPHGTTIIEQLF